MILPVCSICGIVIPESLDGRMVTYTGDEGINMSIPYDSTVSILWPREHDQIWICERCYPHAVSNRFHGSDLAEVHYLFGLEYQEKKVRRLAKTCFRRALAIVRKADYLAALGTLADTRLEKIRLYREALLLDPQCIVASLNLATLLDTV